MKCPPGEVNLQYETTRNIYVTKFHKFRDLTVHVYNKSWLRHGFCEYGQIAGGTCGCSVDNPANVKSVVIAKCTKDIRGSTSTISQRSTGFCTRGVKTVIGTGRYVCCRFNSLHRLGKRFVNFFLAF